MGTTSADAITDDRLVALTLGGDTQAFGRLVDRYRDMVYGLGYHLTGDFEDARDLAQEALVQAYLKLGQLREPDRFGRWLRQIAVNIHRMRERSPRTTMVPLEDASEQAAPQMTETEVVVREALSRVREPERLALTLHYINGYSQAEIGHFLGVRTETVKTRLARARQHLREEMMAMVEDTFDQKKLPAEFAKETVEAAVKRAEEHLKQGRVGAAVEEYQGVLRQQPDYVPAVLGIGLARQAAGQDEEAIHQFRRVLELDPTDQLAYGHLHQVLGGHRERVNEFIALEEEQLKLHPEKAFQLHLSIASLYTSAQQFANAESHLQQARDLEPASPYPLSMLARVLAYQGHYEEAEALFNDAAKAYVALEFDDPVGREWNAFELAHIQCAVGHIDQALETIRPVFLSERESRADRIVERCLMVAERCHHRLNRLDAFADFCHDLRERMPLRSRADRLTWYLALFLESRLQRDQALAEYQRLGAIPAACWRVAVPFDNQGGRGMAAAYPPEQRIALDDPDVGKDGRRIRWHRPWSDGLGFELNFTRQVEVNPFLIEQAIGYAVLIVESPKKHDAVFCFGASGWDQLWLNGESIQLDRVFTGVPDYAAAGLKLKRGRNELLIKVGVREMGPTMRGEFYYWSLFSRITDQSGEPLRDLKFPLGE